MVRLSPILLLLCLTMQACTSDPEALLVNKWKEVEWAYERIDRSPADGQRFDGVRIAAFEERRIVRHETEYWQFRPDRSFSILLEDGSTRTGRWRLKGRGHILTLRYADGGTEVYDVKELNQGALVLNLDLGMEVRGIARLVFSPVSVDPARQAKVAGEREEEQPSAEPRDPGERRRVATLQIREALRTPVAGGSEL